MAQQSLAPPPDQLLTDTTDESGYNKVKSCVLRPLIWHDQEILVLLRPKAAS